MVWVRSEYAGELAVVSAWLAALIPWNVTYSTAEGIGGVLYIRFVFAEFVYFSDLEIDGRSFEFLSIRRAVVQQTGEFVFLAYLMWVLGAVLIAAAVVLSIVYYFRETRVEAGPIDPVRAMGALLCGSGLVLVVANYLIVTRGIPGVPIPIGTLLILVLGGMLLTADRVTEPETEPS
ncbi:DUF7549 family protein [Halorubrum vacuolatum]|uniref:TIGR04206 family protein n=1 Tax=Halorubrum vacuolatum TaxID=63740 RepID=A0A238VCA3_HALVU|nr:hypothetical protein [Halorubrum vacuolatum]SNR31851.1 hypothetical protein SAMN06264855_102233 [Halorubrum vacuolatum]